MAVILIDVAPLSLGIKVVGCVMARIIERNTPIPCDRTKSFTTYSNNQTTIKIQVYEGERAMTSDNYLLGSFLLTGIPPAPRGVSKTEVTFDLDMNGILNVIAQDISTGNSRNITIKNYKGRLSKEKIVKMVADAERYKNEDKKCRQAAEMRNQLESYIVSVMEAADDSGSKLNEDDNRKLQSECDGTLEWMDCNNKASKEELERKLQELKDVCMPIIMKLYK